MIINKKVKSIMMSLAVVLSVFSFSLSVKASYSRDLLSSWDHIYANYSNGYSSEYDTNKEYITVTYVNGYTYTETEKDITNWRDTLSGITFRIHHNRYYSTY